MITDDGHTDRGPADRQGSVEPWLIANHERRFTGFDDNLLALYAP